ncbi:MAG: glycosyltransferase family 2 protein [Bacteroidota bacterium]
MQPLVSIIIPTYNRAHLIGETLDSVLAQTYQNWECIVADDGSTDDTLELLQKYNQRDNRIRFIDRPEGKIKGAASSRNVGFENSKGQYIQYLDSDDLLPPDKLELQIASLSKAAQNTVAACKWGIFKKNVEVDLVVVDKMKYKKRYSPEKFLEALGQGNTYLPPHTYLIPRSLVKKSGGWNENITTNDDAEFMVRVLIKASQIILIKELTVYYRDFSGDNLSFFSNPQRLQSAIKSWILIEKELQLNFGQKRFTYIESSKNRLFQQNKNKYLEVFEEYPSFFKKQLKVEKYRIKVEEYRTFLKEKIKLLLRK